MSITPLAAHAYDRPAPAFRGRIGRDARSGHYAVPRRYRLHLSTADPDGLRIAVTHSLLRLDQACPVTFLPAVPDCPDGGHATLRPLYDASAHRYRGPALAPVLSDDWSGRIVSTHGPDIARDLARHFGGGRPSLHPCGTEQETETAARLCAEVECSAQLAGEAGVSEPGHALGALLDALGGLEQRLGSGPYLTGDQLTAADVDLWVTLVQLDTVHRHHLDAGAVQRVAAHHALWAYARRLTAHPAFGTHLDLDGIDRRHRARCQGLEAAGSAVQILDWAAYRADENRTHQG
ncbi:glutathione S-transferase C-terminal domain-containing protein [Streptomyces acidiscabies]|uniref:Glutathione S-transferase C-terminal domain-containing protein n=1 Tax=Streptomyces acidiscabies TaxID=42234 RepID=A0AAP6BHM3_9ACTN|nr:glutathione S-transferase C-terminal domain-containing protein [Streptomyces acidiscabies]MBP5935291.1 glutathione S-transferase family protein [Streptomyces sp. LBUM 1476]MBZ3916872.1 glutathione S-transferase C-terminal domain-containing protein [Streptomyces acidiscabies]MDX2964891.1 glutathione S-transferase C-terminal domain-containing protein [Streptomyces acidiscabies]MDX3023021.1 glutathione S-transferase C-terminal domain-containing protein [Streptomyces acidiscabies]MDX3792989.1 g